MKQTKTIEEALRASALKFRAAGFETPRLEAEVLLAAVLKHDRLYFLMHGDDGLTERQESQFEALVTRRLNHEPAAQLTGHREFMGLDFLVTRDVLIPRPETENVVEAALDALDTLDTGARVLDLCCGSGAIGLSLLHERPDIRLTLSDISQKALSVAQENAKRLGLTADFVLSDGFEKIDDDFEMIVTNPPYIPTAEIETLASDVKDYEPRLALDGGKDGLDFYKRLFKTAPDYLKRDGYLILECGYDQVLALKKLSADSALKCTQVICDLAEHDRGMVLKRIE